MEVERLRNHNVDVAVVCFAGDFREDGDYAEVEAEEREDVGGDTFVFSFIDAGCVETVGFVGECMAAHGDGGVVVEVG
jgi:hypothetical protein